MHIYIFTYLHIYIHTYIHIYVYTYIHKDVEQSLDNFKRRGTSRLAIVVISYAGRTGSVIVTVSNRKRRARLAANAMLEDRVNTNFSALNDLVLVKLTTRPDVGNIVLVMPWYGQGYGLHPDFDRQMVREIESLRKRGLCVLDATSLVKCTTRYDGLHMENTEHNRLQTIRFY